MEGEPRVEGVEALTHQVVLSTAGDDVSGLLGADHILELQDVRVSREGLRCNGEIARAALAGRLPCPPLPAVCLIGFHPSLATCPPHLPT